MAFPSRAPPRESLVCSTFHTRRYVEELTTFIYHRPILNTLRHSREVKSVDRISYEFLSRCEVADKQTDRGAT
jgi:hypothetical protein